MFGDLLPVDLIISDLGIDAPLLELILALTAEDFVLAVEPFDAITVAAPEIGVAEFGFEIVPVLPISIAAEAAAGVGRGHAIPIRQLLEADIDWDEEDDIEALTVILLLAA